MGWLWLAALGVGAMVALWLLGVSRGLLMFVASALMLGAAGYSRQGSPSLEGNPVTADAREINVDERLVAFRSAIMPGKPGDDRILAAADDRLRAGDTAGAAQVMLDAIAVDPNDAALWTGLGTNLFMHDGGKLSPSALAAFRRALALAPNDPGPVYFLGLAQAMGGNLDAGRAAWQSALALTPADAPYRADLTAQITNIEAMMRGNAAAPPPPQ